MLKSNIIGIDLAKNTLQACHISKHGELLSNKAVSREKLKEIIAKAKPSVVAMEGCASCHYWGRYTEQHGHEVRIIGAKKVKAYVDGHKTDANDALAIANASMQIGLKFSRPKIMEQQSMHSLETSRQFLSRMIVSLGNRIRSTLFEYGNVQAKGIKGLRQAVNTAFECSILPQHLSITTSMLWNQYNKLSDELKQLEKNKDALTRQLEPCRKLMEIEGVAEKTAAMLYVTLGDGKQFKNGRQASAFVGLTPKQHSSGSKTVMMGIDKCGGVKDLRFLLYLGAMSYICRLPETPSDQKQACIALANKTVRTAWAMIRYESEYVRTPLTV